LIDFDVPLTHIDKIEQAFYPNSDNSANMDTEMTLTEMDELLYVDIFGLIVDSVYLMQVLLLLPRMRVAHRLLYKYLIYSACLYCVTTMKQLSQNLKEKRRIKLDIESFLKKKNLKRQRYDL